MRRLCYALILLFSLSAPTAVAQEFGQNDEESLQRLGTLGYLNWHPVAPEDLPKNGVTVFDRRRVSPGVNLHCSQERFEIVVSELSGNVRYMVPLEIKPFGCSVIRLYKKGFLVLSPKRGGALTRLKRNLEVKWQLRGHGIRYFDHDFSVAQNGDIYVLGVMGRNAPTVPTAEVVLDNTIAIVSSEGKIKKEYSLLNILSSSEEISRVFQDPKHEHHGYGKGRSDIFHSNAIQVIDSGLERHKGFPKGSVLVTVRHLNRVVLLDLDEQKVLAHWGGGYLDWPHHGTLLDNGRILVFDNQNKKKASRVVEIDPRSDQIVWEYSAKGFFTALGGSVERLDNGNTLITESARGRVFEVTPQKEIVWEWFNPLLNVSKKDGKRSRAFVFRMSRVDADLLRLLRGR